MSNVSFRFGGSWHHRSLAAGGLEGDPTLRGSAWWQEVRAPFDVVVGEDSLLGVQPDEPVLPLLEAWTSGLEELAAASRTSFLLELQESPHEISLVALPTGWRVQVCRTHAPTLALYRSESLAWQDVIDLVLQPVHAAIHPLRESARRGGSTGLVARFQSLQDRLDALLALEPVQEAVGEASEQPLLEVWSEGQGTMRVVSRLDLRDAALARWLGDEPTSVSWLAVPGSVEVTFGDGPGRFLSHGAPLLGWMDAMQGIAALANASSRRPSSIGVASDDTASLRLVLEGSGAVSLEVTDQAGVRRVPVEPSDVLALLADHVLSLLHHLEVALPLTATHVRLVSLREVASSIRRAAALAAARPLRPPPTEEPHAIQAPPPRQRSTSTPALALSGLPHPARSLRHLWWSWTLSRLVGPAQGTARLHCADHQVLVSERNRTRVFADESLRRLWWNRGQVVAISSTLGVVLLQTAGGCVGVDRETGATRWVRKGVFPAGEGQLVSLSVEGDAWAMREGSMGTALLRLESGMWESTGSWSSRCDRFWKLGGSWVATGSEDGRWSVVDMRTGQVLWEHALALPPRHVFRLGDSVVALLGAPWGEGWGMERRALEGGSLEEAWVAEGDLLEVAQAPHRAECIAVIQRGEGCVLHGWQENAHGSMRIPRWSPAWGETVTAHPLSSGWLLQWPRITLDVADASMPRDLTWEVRGVHKAPGAIRAYRDLWIRAGQELALHAAGVERPLATLPCVWEDLVDIGLSEDGVVCALEDRGGMLYLHRAEVQGFLADLGGGLA